jgi:predicted nucleic acid-binding protein
VKLLLDTNIVTRLCHPAHEENRPVAEWIEKVLGLSEPIVCVPEIVDYEVRRGLLHVALRSGEANGPEVIA